jgi:hypothetical protein
MKNAVFNVARPLQLEDRDGGMPRIDDPVFGDVCFHIIVAFVNQIALRLVRAEDFNDQVGTQQAAILTSWIVSVLDEDDIGFTEFSLANPQPQWRI